MIRGSTMTAIVAAACLIVSTSAAAQSLGDVARRESERRGAAPPATKTYTNENLTPDFTKPTVPSAVPADVATPEAGAGQPTEAVNEEEAARQQEREDAEKWGVTPRDEQEPAPLDDHKEEFWRTRSSLIKARLAKQNEQIQQLRERMAATRGSGDAERDVLERTFATAEANLKHINDEWLRFENQARDRKVPENWWR